MPVLLLRRVCRVSFNQPGAAMKAPFPYFGGKSTIAHEVWNALGEVNQYIEPFFGSGAVLLNRPEHHDKTYEIVNDKDGFICNVWRALQADPDAVAKFCDWPINHADLNARRKFLIANEGALLRGLESDPAWFDSKMAGYWIWAASSWIGTGLTRANARPHLARNQGVNSGGKRPHLARNQGVNSGGQRPHLADNMGVNSGGQRPHLTCNKGVQDPYNARTYEWFRELSERLRYVKVVCGSWERVCGGNWQNRNGLVGIFFDPPYSHESRDDSIYHHDSMTVALDVEKWCLPRGDNPDYRIVCAGYEGEYPTLESAGWSKIEWKANGGYSNLGGGVNNNHHTERLWLSPHCMGMTTGLPLFNQGDKNADT